MDKKPENKKDFSYFITVFFLEGHTSWRCHMTTKRDGFEKDETKNWGKNPPKVKEKRVYRIDRVSGKIYELKP